MRSSYKKQAENHSYAMEKHMGQIIDDIWEVLRICSQVIDHCLHMDNVQSVSLLLILRNMISDCCACLDAFERGHERTIFNNIRMSLEDFACVVHAKNDHVILESLLAGNYQSSRSISFLRDNYPTHEFNITYGWLSKWSHHSMEGLVFRQWVNRDGLLSHLKPFDLGRKQHLLDALLIIVHLARLAGEEAESLCFNELDRSYFWINQTTPNRSTPIDAIITEIANRIDFMEINKSVSTIENATVS